VRYNWDGYDLIDDYKTLESAGYKPEDWKDCTKCEAKPKVWLFDNGRYAACKCFSMYSQKVKAESIMSASKRNNMVDYNKNELRDNWNKFIDTGLFFGEFKDGRW